MAEWGRQKYRPCQTQGCRNHVRAGFRYCSYCGTKILKDLRDSKEYWRHDFASTEDGNNGMASPSLD